MLDQNYIRNLCISIGYPIGDPSKIYKENQAKIKGLLLYRIAPQASTLIILVTGLREHHI